MTNELFIKIISAIITIAVSLITAFVIPWIKTKVSAEQMRQIEDYIHKAVRCAEQIYTPEQWAEKKQFVLDYMLDVVNEKFTLTLSQEDLDILIEGVVNQVKKG